MNNLAATGWAMLLAGIGIFAVGVWLTENLLSDASAVAVALAAMLAVSGPVVGLFGLISLVFSAFVMDFFNEKQELLETEFNMREELG